MSLHSKFEESRQYDTEGTGTSPLDPTLAYTLLATNPWPDVAKAVVPTGKTRFTQVGQFYTDSYVDTQATLNTASKDLQNLT